MNIHDPRETLLTPSTRPVLDITKPCKTAAGKPVRYIGARVHPLYIHLFGLPDANGVESEIRNVTEKGEFYAGSQCDLDIIN